MDPRERLTAGDAAAREGRYAEALREYIWFHDHALEHRPALYGVRLSFALASWMDLAKVFPDARRELEEIRNRKAAILASRQGNRDLFHDVASINEYLGAEDETYRLFKALLKSAPLNAVAWADLAREAIVKAGDFALAAEHLDHPEEALLRYSDRLNRDVAELTPERERKYPILDAYVHIYVDRIALVVTILEGLNQVEDARACIDWAIALVDSRRVRIRVIDALAGRYDA
jgi:tetratricopeptide (TPR) repeat protein